jgi:hypothetical protein
MAIMKNAYVVRELVSVASGEKDFRTHYEYGRFATFEAANQCAMRTENQSCFPQREDVARSIGTGHGNRNKEMPN